MELGLLEIISSSEHVDTQLPPLQCKTATRADTIDTFSSKQMFSRNVAHWILMKSQT